MEQIELVIKMPKRAYERFVTHEQTKKDEVGIANEIRNGTPLPKDNDVLDKIRAEVEKKIIKRPWLDFKDMERDRNDAFLEVLDIIDKYKTESVKGARR